MIVLFQIFYILFYYFGDYFDDQVYDFCWMHSVCHLEIYIPSVWWMEYSVDVLGPIDV